MVEIVKNSGAFFEQFVQEMNDHGIKYHCSPIPNNKFGILLFPFWFIWIYLRYKPSVIHCHTEVPDLACWWFRRVFGLFISKKTKFVRTIHNTELWNEWKSIGKMVEIYYVKQHSNVAISQSVKDIYTNVYGDNDIPLIYNGVEEVKQEPFGGIVPNVINVLFAGRLEHQKGILTLIDVVKRMKDNTQIHFHIVGNGSLLGDVKNAIGGLHNVTMYDKIYNLPQYIGSFDYLFMPSVHEGLGLVAIESELAKTLVVINDIPGLIETVPQGWPFAVKNNNVDEYVRILTAKIDIKKKATLTEEAYKHVKKTFSLQQMQERYEAFYRQA